MLNNRYIKSIFFVLISFPVFLFQFLFCYILERKDMKWFKRDIIVLISFLIIFVSISFLVNIGKEMSLPGFRIDESKNVRTTPTRTYCKRSRPLSYSYPKCRTPQHWKLTQHLCTTRPPTIFYKDILHGLIKKGTEYQSLYEEMFFWHLLVI